MSRRRQALANRPVPRLWIKQRSAKRLLMNCQ
jgi:hypothetical protein